MYFFHTGATWNVFQVVLEIGFDKPSCTNNHWNNVNVLQFQGLSQVILGVLVLIYLMTFGPVQTEVVGDRYLNDFCLLVLLVLNDNVWLNGPSFNISPGEHSFVVKNGNVLGDGW